MNFHFTQHEVESKLYKILEYGDEAKIAERINKSGSIVSQMCNPDNERESDFYKAIEFICAEMDISPERGMRLLELLVSMCERHKPAGKNLCPIQETKKLKNEHEEFIDTRLEGMPENEQLKELGDIRRQCDVVEAAIIARRNEKSFEQQALERSH